MKKINEFLDFDYYIYSYTKQAFFIKVNNRK